MEIESGHIIITTSIRMVEFAHTPFVVIVILSAWFISIYRQEWVLCLFISPFLHFMNIYDFPKT